MFTFERIIRFWVPAAIFAVCAAMLVVSPNIVGLEAAGVVFGGGGAIVVVNYIQRVGFAGDVDRHKEAESREFMQRFGIWPTQASPELLERARHEGMLEHVTIRARTPSRS